MGLKFYDALCYNLFDAVRYDKLNFDSIANWFVF